jgi:hypothetical protein
MQAHKLGLAMEKLDWGKQVLLQPTPFPPVSKLVSRLDRIELCWVGKPDTFHGREDTSRLELPLPVALAGGPVLLKKAVMHLQKSL